MNSSPTALNRRLLAVEEDYGRPIFERLPKGLRPTEAGVLILRHMEAELARHDDLCTQIGDLDGLRRGHVAIA